MIPEFSILSSKGFDGFTSISNPTTIGPDGETIRKNIRTRSQTSSVVCIIIINNNTN
jgi:hypothetical protein